MTKLTPNHSNLNSPSSQKPRETMSLKQKSLMGLAMGATALSLGLESPREAIVNGIDRLNNRPVEEMISSMSRVPLPDIQYMSHKNEIKQNFQGFNELTKEILDNYKGSRPLNFMIL
ncbi:MAG: hypothetical protein HRT47_10290 [Candidatus Caenarcaniphilales bacterium]|nr:hypothetical protein [Candidatus Caenarcaniphilales bacterium]